MDEAARTRRAARDAVDDIEPERLRAVIEETLDAGSMAPGALTLVSAHATDESVDIDRIADRAAGVQLIYDGLRLTRLLASDEPWATTDDQTAANLDVLAVNVLVSRGFYLLARTDAADAAVRTIRAFGRDQTRLQTGDDGETLRTGLEANVLELAVIAGVTAVGATPDATVRDRVVALAHDCGTPLPPTDETLPDDIRTWFGSGTNHEATPSVSDS